MSKCVQKKVRSPRRSRSLEKGDEREKKRLRSRHRREREKKKERQKKKLVSGCRVQQHNMQSLTFTSRAVRERVFIHVAPFESENAFCVVASA